MRMIGRLAFGMVLGLSVSSASAFEVERGEAAPKPPAAETKAEVVAPGGVVKKKSSEGTVVRIPGIGKIGVLPKLDFGLELLYGQNKGADEVGESGLKTETEDGDFRVRGSIKHRF